MQSVKRKIGLDATSDFYITCVIILAAAWISADIESLKKKIENK